jgi:signal transduction histidine kinase
MKRRDDNLVSDTEFKIKLQNIPNHIADRAIATGHKITEIEKGNELDIIEVIRNPSRTRHLYLETLVSANDEILLIFPTANSFLRQEKIGIIDVLNDATVQRNVKVRILVPIHPLIEKLVEQQPFLLPAATYKIGTNKKNSNFKSIRYIQEISGTRATILVVDKSTSLVMELKDDSRDSFEAAMGFSIYSTNLSRILPYASIFENLWIQAELYHQIKKANEKLRIQDKINKEFISIAAHELRAPIQPILGLSYLLKYKKELLKGKEEESLEIIMRNAEMLQRLAENMLDLTKIENHRLNLKKKIFDLDELLCNIVFDFGKQFEQQQQEQQVKTKIELRYYNQMSFNEITEASQIRQRLGNNIKIEGNKERIYQVISNLINNAIKSIDEQNGEGEGGAKVGKIELTTRIEHNHHHKDSEYQIEYHSKFDNNNINNNIHNSTDNNSTDSIIPDIVVIVAVKDTGRGIDAEIMPRLFTRFATNFRTGTGLGLFISKSIIEAHKGKIYAYNNKGGQGTTFEFSLPLKQFK